MLEQVDTEVAERRDVQARRHLGPGRDDGAFDARVVGAEGDHVLGLEPRRARDVGSRVPLAPQLAIVVEERVPAGAEQEHVAPADIDSLGARAALHLLRGHDPAEGKVPDPLVAGEVEHHAAGDEAAGPC